MLFLSRLVLQTPSTRATHRRTVRSGLRVWRRPRATWPSLSQSRLVRHGPTFLKRGTHTHTHTVLQSLDCLSCRTRTYADDSQRWILFRTFLKAILRCRDRRTARDDSVSTRGVHRDDGPHVTHTPTHTHTHAHTQFCQTLFLVSAREALFERCSRVPPSAVLWCFQLHRVGAGHVL